MVPKKSFSKREGSDMQKESDLQKQKETEAFSRNNLLRRSPPIIIRQEPITPPSPSNLFNEFPLNFRRESITSPTLSEIGKYVDIIKRTKPS